MNKLNIGVNGSIGFSINIVKAKIFIEAEGDYGFLNINKQTENGKSYIESINVRTGLSYNIGPIFQ